MEELTIVMVKEIDRLESERFGFVEHHYELRYRSFQLLLVDNNTNKHRTTVRQARAKLMATATYL